MTDGPDAEPGAEAGGDPWELGRPGMVSVWLAAALDDDALASYFLPALAGEGQEEAPPVGFAFDWGLPPIDGDFVEVCPAGDDGPKPLADLLSGASYSESFAEAVLARHAGKSGTFAVLLFDCEYPELEDPPAGPMEFLGAYRYATDEGDSAEE